jgi:hypothetical protein
VLILGCNTRSASSGRLLQGALDFRAQGHLDKGGYVAAGTCVTFNPGSKLSRRGAGALDDLPHEASLISQQPEQEMVKIQDLTAQLRGFIASKEKGLARIFCKSLEHHIDP